MCLQRWSSISQILLLLSSFVEQHNCTNTINYCVQPEVPENCHVIFPSAGPYAPGTRAKYNCAVGYIQIGAIERICLHNGTWSDRAPICGVNVALHRAAQQSSDDDDRHTVASFAIDDDHDNCASSDTWWSVDLLETYQIHAIQVVIGNAHQQIDSIEISTQVHDDGTMHRGIICNNEYSMSSSTSVQISSKNNSIERTRHTIVCKLPLNADRIMITSKNAAALHICQVVVLSATVASTWQCGHSSSSMDVFDGVHKGYCYSASADEKLPWKSAQSRCLQEGGSLPLKLDKQQQHYLRTQLHHRTKHTDSPFYWIGVMTSGGTSNEQQKIWRWADGEPILDDEADWAERSPSPNNSEHTQAFGVVMSRPVGWHWMSSSQSVWNGWICQTKPKFCTSPGVPEAGRVLFSSQTYAIGTIAYYSCERGYRLANESMARRDCGNDGRWSGTIPLCQAVDCLHPGRWTDGRMHLINASTTFLSIAEYRCPIGARLVDGESIHLRVCEADGHWSGHAPICREIHCPAPEKIANGTVYARSIRFNATAKYKCASGFRLVGNEQTRCDETGAWKPDAPVCYDWVSFRKFFADDNHSNETNLLLALVILALFVLILSLSTMAFVWRRRKHPDPFSMSTLYAMPSYTSEKIYSVSAVARPLSSSSSTCNHQLAIGGSNHHDDEPIGDDCSLDGGGGSSTGGDCIYEQRNGGGGATPSDAVIYYSSTVTNVNGMRQVLSEPAVLTQLEIPPQLLRLQQLPNGNIHVTLPCPRSAQRRPSIPHLMRQSPLAVASNGSGLLTRSDSSIGLSGRTHRPIEKKQQRHQHTTTKFQTMVTNVRNRLAAELKAYANGGGNNSTVAHPYAETRRRLNASDIVLIGPSTTTTTTGPSSVASDSKPPRSSPTPSELLYGWEDDDNEEDNVDDNIYARSNQPLYDVPPDVCVSVGGGGGGADENVYEELPQHGTTTRTIEMVNTIC